MCPTAFRSTRRPGLSIAYGTTIHALKQRAEMKPGETLVVLGASGGVGLAAVEIGRAMGARVIACASSDDKLDFARRYGADETINYATEDLRARLKDLTGAKGVDVVYDPVGGALAEPALRSLGWKGRFLVIGFASGEIPRPPLNVILLKGCDIRGVYWGEFTAREPEANRDNMSQLLEMGAKAAQSASTFTQNTRLRSTRRRSRRSPGARRSERRCFGCRAPERINPRACKLCCSAPYRPRDEAPRPNRRGHYERDETVHQPGNPAALAVGHGSVSRPSVAARFAQPA